MYARLRGEGRVFESGWFLSPLGFGNQIRRICDCLFGVTLTRSEVFRAWDIILTNCASSPFMEITEECLIRCRGNFAFDTDSVDGMGGLLLRL